MFTPDHWAYTRRQRLGLTVLVLLLGASFLASEWLQRTRTPYPTHDQAEFFAAAEKLRNDAGFEPEQLYTPKTAESFRFDPNTVTAEELQRLGLSRKQAASWIKFRAKRPFRHANEIAKLYVLKPDQVEHLLPLARVDAPQRESATASLTAYAEPTSRERFSFDPNTLSADSLRLLGFSERGTNALLKYRSYREITFRKPEDLRRVGALDKQLVEEVIPLIDIKLPEAPERPQPDRAPASAPTLATASFDINTNPVSEWEKLPGIGNYRAGRIVKFRDLLGGFVSVEQVATTYGLPDSSFQKIAPYLVASPIFRKLDINKMSAAELGAHPYLKRKTAEVIVRYRDNHGPFSGPDDLKKVLALSDENRSQLLPYLNFAQ